MEKNYFNTADASLYFIMEGAGPPLVFIHGFCLDHRMWESQLKFFSPNYTVIVIDLRGFGYSSPPGDKPYSHHADIFNLLEFLNIAQPVILVGLSMGAGVVANFALTYPQKTKAIIFADAAIDGYKFKTFDLAYIYNSGKELGVRIANKMWLDHPLFDHVRENAALVQQLTEMIMSYSGWHWTNKNPVKKLNPAAWEQLQNLTMPTLILTGQYDIPDFQDIAQMLNTKIENSSIKEIPGAGHMCNMEMPEVFNELVNQFLDQIVKTNQQ